MARNCEDLEKGFREGYKRGHSDGEYEGSKKFCDWLKKEGYLDIDSTPDTDALVDEWLDTTE